MEPGDPAELFPGSDAGQETLSGVFGKTMTEIGEILFPSLPPQERNDLLEICFETENRYLEDHPGEMYPGVAEIIPMLAEKYPALYCKQLPVRLH